jgi:hypothetical protein
MRDPKTGQFLPGVSGNPAGRFPPGESGDPALRFRPGEAGTPASVPRGTRRRLLERFVEDLYRDWHENGAAVLETLRTKRPQDYVRAVIAVLPKEIKVEHSAEMTDDQLIQRIRQLASELGIALGFPEGVLRPLPKLEAPDGGEPAQKLLPVR